ncbi:MAG: hypothetical protein KDC52_12070, partial [Ignavibacteriae bacterium]|nr:hypothetical protein [Ignavibacteriota bacterium]
ISYENNIITTGSMNEEGQIGAVGGEIIRTKLITASYSITNKFIVPLDDLNSAIEVLNTLNEKFPKRKLAIIPMQNINDVINRRDIVGIEKQNIVRWGSKKLIKNKIAVSLAIILTAVLLSFYYVNQDKNPASIEMLDGKIFIKNKVNKVLWSKDYSACTEKILNVVSSYPYNKCRIIDVDNDGKNEVLVALSEGSNNLFLYNSIGEVIWEYKHADSLGTKDEKFTGQFNILGIIDTIHANGKIELLIYFQHYNYYPTGIAKLDLLTGEKISDVLWHPGAIGGAVLVDWNKDGKKEIIAGGASNGMHKAYLFSIDHDKLSGTFPTSENYTFINKQLSEFNNYILFSQTDYGQHFFPKYNAVLGVPEIVNQYLSIGVFEGKANLLEADFSYGIRFNNMLVPVQTVIGDKFVVFRDKLINDGILNPPYTDAPEFHDSIL